MNKKKIGLALGSGMTRAGRISGFSVLKELSVPVHCVAGTSISALVGGFTPQAGWMRFDVALHLDWKRAFHIFLK